MDTHGETGVGGRWMTYSELAEELGLSSRDAARKRVERDQKRPVDEQQWEKREDVQGQVYVRLRGEHPDATDGEDTTDAEPEWALEQAPRLQPIIYDSSALESVQDGLKEVYETLLSEKDVRIDEWRTRALAAEKRLAELTEPKALPKPDVQDGRPWWRRLFGE